MQARPRPTVVPSAYPLPHRPMQLALFYTLIDAVAVAVAVGVINLEY